MKHPVLGIEIPTCRTCFFAQPNGKGTRAGAAGENSREVEIGLCHGDVPALTITNSGAFRPITLDEDWCRHHPDLKLPTPKKGNRR